MNGYFAEFLPFLSFLCIVAHFSLIASPISPVRRDPRHAFSGLVFRIGNCVSIPFSKNIQPPRRQQKGRINILPFYRLMNQMTFRAISTCRSTKAA